MTTALTRLAGSAFEITITVPWADIKKIYDEVFEELAAEMEVEGFRKGKAPRDLIEGKVDKSKIYGEVVNRILPESYAKALEEHSIKPVISPKVQITSADQDKDWQFIARSAEKPSVTLGNYQDAVKTINASGKIWTPGQKAEEKKDDEERSKKVSAIIDKLLEVCQVELAEILIESEVNRLLSALIDDVRQAGLTYEQYLTSSNQTADKVKEKYLKQAQTALKLEFILEAVANDLDIKVSETEINAVIDKEPDPTKKQALKDQSYLLASILRRENTLTKLLAL
ncbi:hypothetical protein HY440_03250 [Candidatus Microgenomates bacterium]|nr:hypothetical protein [Candidatus Microgenomates bacterium]